MLKNAYFLKKIVTFRLSVESEVGWGLRPQTPRVVSLLSPTNITLLGAFLALNAVYYPKKKNKIATVNVLFLLLPHFLHLFSLQNL